MMIVSYVAGEHLRTGRGQIFHCPTALRKKKKGTDMIDFNIGILGAGAIAAKVADTLEKLDSFRAGAIASRDLARANAFAEEHNIEKAYGSYDELLADPDIELVYIATTNNTHAELAKKCLEAGKPVLVEKPFSYNAKTASEVLTLAREKKLFCGEAMWTRFTPIVQHLRDLITTKAVGMIRCGTATLGYNLQDKERLENPEQAGGALLDLGVYPLTMLFLVMGGPPVQMSTAFNPLPSGVDAMETISMNFAQGQVGTVYTTMMAEMDNRIVLYGTAGRIEIEGTNLPTALRVYDYNNELLEEVFPSKTQISGYEYEFLAARNAVITGSTETEEMRHLDTMQLLGFMDAIRKAWKVTYPLPGEEELQDTSSDTRA